jgi:hypothetical protein
MDQDKQLVSFQDLSDDLELAVKRDKLNELLNRSPREAWLRKHKFIKVKEGEQTVALKYIPVGTVRLLMRAIFQRTRREIISVGQVCNSIQAIVRVHYRDPITGEWDWQDGVGAVPIQLDSDSKAADLGNIKNNAIQLGSPAAVSYAYKNACEEIGNIFGASIQKDTPKFTGMYDIKPTEEKPTTTASTPQQEEITTDF